jgi:hypothetical protein
MNGNSFQDHLNGSIGSNVVLSHEPNPDQLVKLKDDLMKDISGVMKDMFKK